MSTGTTPSPTTSYGPRLQAAVARRGALCVGVDPHPAILRAWGLDADVAGLERCARGLVEALGDSVAVFKPQSAFFEAYGSPGVAVLERVVRMAMLVSLPQVQPEAYPHQHRRRPKKQIGRLRPQDKRNNDAKERRD